MAATTSKAESYVHVPDKTFKSYDAKQAATYAEHRPGYNPVLVAYVLDQHGSTGGGNSCVVDLGTGHANVLRAFAPHFDSAIGADPSVEMVREAERLCALEGTKTRSGGAPKVMVGSAEGCDQLEGIDEGSVDLIVAGTAAHWFNLNDFWTTAAKVVKPGGTVAFWVRSSLYIHPAQPNASEIQRVLSHFEDVTLEPYRIPGNTLAQDGYTRLPFPKDLPESHPAHAAFPGALHSRRDWNRDGACAADEDFFSGAGDVTPQQLGLSLATASMVTRWRADEANAGKEDIVEVFVRELEGVVGKGVTMKLGTWTALVMCKRA